MTDTDPKSTLHEYLRTARETVLWKLDGLSDHDVRRPLTPTGTNLLGLVKHLAMVEVGYFGLVFDRPMPDTPAWIVELDNLEPNADMWATAEESREEIVGLYRRAAAHADTTVDALDLGSTGQVPWWPAERNQVTLHRVLVHVVAETNRHAGHADIVRESIDGSAGLLAKHDNLPPADRAWWEGYRNRLQQVAEQFREV